MEMINVEPTILSNLGTIVSTLWTLFLQLFVVLRPWLIPIFLLAWCIFGIRWQRAWSALKHGGWAPFVLLILLGALVWSQLAPSEATVFGWPVANFWWQLLYSSIAAAGVLFCGFLQGALHWTPAEVNLTPSAHGHGDHGHGHGHGHDDHNHGGHGHSSHDTQASSSAHANDHGHGAHH